MNIVTAYKYFYYRTYRMQIGVFKDQGPKLTAMFVTTLLMNLNLFTLIACIEIATGYKIRIETPYTVVIALLLLSANFFFLFWRNKSKAIVEEFEFETEEQRKRRALWCWAYEIGTYAAFFGSIMILSPGSK